MYVKAPWRPTSGTTTVAFNHLLCHQTSERFVNQAGATNALEDLNQELYSTSGITRRAFLQPGRIGPNLFVDTQYAADYKRYQSSDDVIKHIVQVTSGTKPWSSASYPIGFGYSGFYESGLGSTFLEDVNPEGTTGGIIAVANRLAIGNLRNRALTEARLKALNQTMDVAESLVGLDKTAIMVAKSASSVLKAWRAVRRGSVLGAMRHLGLDPKHLTGKDLADKWLALQYGWMPLLMDIYNGTEEIKRKLDPSREPHQFYSITTCSTGLMLSDPVIPAVWTEYDLSKSASAGVKARFNFSVTEPFSAYINSLGVTNPAYIAWIALPFSFVVDWLVPVGDMLAASSAGIGLKFAGGHCSTRAHARVGIVATKRFAGNPANIKTLIQSGKASAFAEALYVRRIAYTSWPYNVLYFKFPFSSDKRVANAVALIVSTSQRRG